MRNDTEPPEIPEPPTQSKAALAIGKTAEAAASFVPFVGGPLAVAIATAFGHAYEKRIDVWRQQLTEAVQWLTENTGVKVEDLADDDNFLDIVAVATQVAGRSSSTEKRRLLANALIRVGSGDAPSQDKQAIYLRYVDELTPSHMRMIAFLDNPVGYCSDAGIAWPDYEFSSLRQVIGDVLPDLAEDSALLETVVADLARYGLTSDPGLKTMMSSAGLQARRGTTKGSEFVAFVTGPFSNAAPA